MNPETLKHEKKAVAFSKVPLNLPQDSSFLSNLVQHELGLDRSQLTSIVTNGLIHLGTYLYDLGIKIMGTSLTGNNILHNELSIFYNTKKSVNIKLLNSTT